jgi:two-component system cell cycle response regulator DivK
MAAELILVVEDNPRNLRLARDLLQLHGFHTLEATTGTEALALARSHALRLILLDIQLPDLDGPSVLAQLRADPATARIPVVALTAFAMHGDRERFLNVGFDGYISKPIEVKTFAELVRRLCDEIGSGAQA